MTLRGTAVPLRRSPSWRRSGDDSHWESLLSGGEAPSPPRRPARPQSVSSERGPADHWLWEPERTQRGTPRDPPQDHRGPGPPYDRPTPTMPTLHTQDPPPRGPDRTPPATTRRTSYRGEDSPPYSRTPSGGSGSRGGSQESLLGPDRGAPGERRGSHERARMVQGPVPGQARVSALAPVRVGWLPVQRRVSGIGDPPQGQTPRAESQPSAQMKMKQPITPILQASPSNGFKHHDGEAEQREAGPYGPRAGARCSPETRCSPERKEWSTSEWSTSTVATPPLQQVSNKISVATKERGPLTWQSLRRGWGFCKISALSGGSKVSPRPPGTEVRTPPPPSSEGWGLHPPLYRTGSAQPAGSTARRDGVSRPSPRETASVATTTTTTTLVPHDKVSFSSITICSKKVTRTTSLPPDNDNNVHRAAPPSHPGQRPPGAPDSVTLRRKATVVKVTEQRMTSASFPSAATAPARRPSPDRVAPGDGRQGDAAVHRRKATVIKVTERRESYSAAVTPGNRPPHYRHSYTEGVYTEDSVWRQGPQGHQGPQGPQERYVGPPQRGPFQRGPPEDRWGPVAPQGGDLGRGGGDRALHRSTLSLVLSGGGEPRPALPPPAWGPGAGGAPGGSRPRPVSCYGNVFGHTEAAHVAVATKPCLTRMLSWGNVLPQQARGIPPQPSEGGGGGGGGGLPSSTGVPEPNGDGKEGTVHVVSRRASLTLLKPPGAGSTRSAQDILALNAAAIIANIKLQRQLRNPEDGRPAKDAAASSSLQGNEDGVVGKVEKSNPGQKLVGHPSPDPQQPDQSPSLKEALERSRPGFIARSQDRVETLRRRTQERRRRLAARPPGPAGAPRGGGPSGPTRSRPPPLDASLSDNLSRRRDGAVTVREEEPRSLHPPSGPSAGERSRKEVAKREACLANRRRVELFKKRLLDQILHRNHL